LKQQHHHLSGHYLVDSIIRIYIGSSSVAVSFWGSIIIILYSFLYHSCTIHSCIILVLVDSIIRFSGSSSVAVSFWGSFIIILYSFLYYSCITSCSCIISCHNQFILFVFQGSTCQFINFVITLLTLLIL
jgi:hypothetical protein